MFSNYSKTQAENIGKFLGFILMVSGHQVDDSAIDGFLTVTGAIIGLVSTGISYLRRFSKGDLTLGGARK